MKGEPTKKNAVFYVILALLLCALVVSKVINKLSPDEIDNSNVIRLMGYNVENLFDTIDNPDTKDDDLTPKGSLRWTEKRMKQKLERIEDVILSMNITPSFIALTEVENSSVVKALLNQEELKAENYDFAISDSQDYRGVNLTFLYKKDIFRLIEQHSYRPNIGSKKRPIYSRDILHVTGILNANDTLDFFVCHFPSRGGGEKKTEPNRIAVAKRLKQAIDSVHNHRPTARLIVVGDFNDSPLDKSINSTLSAKSILEHSKRNTLHNMFYEEEKENQDHSRGTYKYRDKWEYLDQFIVNGNMLNSQYGIKIKDNKAHVYDADFLLENDRRNKGDVPYRTYVGRNYIGGYSDHLPIYMDFEILN